MEIDPTADEYNYDTWRDDWSCQLDEDIMDLCDKFLNADNGLFEDNPEKFFKEVLGILSVELGLKPLSESFDRIVMEVKNEKLSKLQKRDDLNGMPSFQHNGVKDSHVCLECGYFIHFLDEEELENYIEAEPDGN